MHVSEEGKEVTQWISQQCYCITDLASFMFDEPDRQNVQVLVEVPILFVYHSDSHEKLLILFPSGTN